MYRRTRVAWEPEQQFYPSDGQDEDAFGRSAAIADGFALFGTRWGSNDAGVRCGAAYLFSSSAPYNWEETRKFSDATLPEGTFYGVELAMTDSVIAIGATDYIDPGHGATGAVYVYEPDADGDWVEAARLLASDRSGGDELGSTIAIHRNVIAAGAPYDDPLGFGSGSAYVFDRDEFGNRIETAKLVPSGGRALQLFGWSIAVGDGVVIVGTIGDRHADNGAGSAYVFNRDAAGEWVEQARIDPPDPAFAASFGASVAIDGDLAIIGAETHQAACSYCGAAFVYERTPDGSWQLIGTLTASEPQDQAKYGRATAIRGNIAVVGAPYKDLLDERGRVIADAGEAYIYAVGPDRDGDGEMDVCGCREAYGGLAGILGNPDLNNDRVVDLADLAILLSNFGADRRDDPETSFPMHEHGDLDLDQDIDLTDLGLMLRAQGATCD